MDFSFQYIARTCSRNPVSMDNAPEMVDLSPGPKERLIEKEHGAQVSVAGKAGQALIS